jgi:hypothetical protein
MRLIGADEGRLGRRIQKRHLNISGYPEVMPQLAENLLLIGGVDVPYAVKLHICSSVADMRDLHDMGEFPHQIHWFTAPRDLVEKELGEPVL